MSEAGATVLPQTSELGEPAVVDGPPPPQPPAVISRDAAGRATIRAVRVDRVTIDGVLDERLYQDVPSVSGFIQQEPLEGAAPATEQTEVWVVVRRRQLLPQCPLLELCT